MARAIALAARGLGTTSPNPVVGCVLLDAGGEVVGEGFHAYAGGPHAEIVALAQAGERAKGGTAVVTLEPCNHTGRTGPCSEALISAGVARVVIAVDDPNPVATGGAQRLRAAGVEVIVGVRAVEAEEGNIAWLTAVRRGRPYVIWKSAPPWTAARPPPTAPACGSPPRRPGWTCTGCAARSTRSWSASARSSPTIPA